MNTMVDKLLQLEEKRRLDPDADAIEFGLQMQALWTELVQRGEDEAAVAFLEAQGHLCWDVVFVGLNQARRPGWADDQAPAAVGYSSLLN